MARGELLLEAVCFCFEAVQDQIFLGAERDLTKFRSSERVHAHNFFLSFVWQQKKQKCLAE